MNKAWTCFIIIWLLSKQDWWLMNNEKYLYTCMIFCSFGYDKKARQDWFTRITHDLAPTALIQRTCSLCDSSTQLASNSRCFSPKKQHVFTTNDKEWEKEKIEKILIFRSIRIFDLPKQKVQLRFDRKKFIKKRRRQTRKYYIRVETSWRRCRRRRQRRQRNGARLLEYSANSEQKLTAHV